MFNIRYLLVLFIVESGFPLGIRELDNIFKDAECIEGEFMLQNVGELWDSSDRSNLILVKNHEINLSSRSSQTTDVLVEMKKNVEENKNALNTINELAQFNKIAIEFLLVEELGEAHEKTFRVRLNLGDEVYQASAKRIKDAKRKAASNAIIGTKYQHPPIRTPEQIERNVQQLTPTVHLNNIAGKLGIKVEYYNEADNVLIDVSDKYMYYSLDTSPRSYMSKLNDSLRTNLNIKAPSVENSAHGGPFRVRVEIGDEHFIGTGWTIQAARHDAAVNALEKFRKMSIQDAEECLHSGQLCNKLNVKSPISLVHEIATTHRWGISFDIIDESGPAHKKLFVTRCKLGDMSTNGEGNSKKTSKKAAAEAMLKMLETVQPWDLINVRAGDGNDQKKKKKNKKKSITRPDAMQQASMNVLDAFGAISGSKIVDRDRTAESNNVDDIGPKGELLRLGREIGINIRFSSYQNEETDQNGCLVTLDTEPGYHCYGKESPTVTAENNAALNALKFLKHVGLDNIMIPLKNPDGKKIILFEDTSHVEPVTKYLKKM